MTVKTYNTEFYPMLNKARSFIYCIEHAIDKCDNPDSVRHQLACIGYDEDLKIFLLDCLTTVDESVRKEITFGN